MKDFSNTNPKTIEEAVEILESCLEEEDRKEILENDLNSLLSLSHMGLGMTIRNCWVYRDDSNLLADDGPFFIGHPDMVSEEILEAFFRKVKSDNNE